MEITQELIDSLQVSEMDIIKKISETLNIEIRKVVPTVGLLKEGNTIPFISRYRKEATGTLDEVEVRDISHKLSYFENLESRRLEIVKGIFAQNKLTELLLSNIMKATTATELEDIYAPYKRKKKTRGMIAIEKGLEPLADFIEKEKDEAIKIEAAKYIDAEKDIKTADDAINGACDIIAERVSHTIDNRSLIKDFIMKNGKFVVKGLKDEASSVYKMYYDYSEQLNTVKSHRVLAINRGEREEELEAKIDYEEEAVIKLLLSKHTIKNIYMKSAVEDGLKRLLLPAVIREIRNDFSDKADEHGIETFSVNLKNLLMQPPIKMTRVLGIDPGIRTGSKSAVMDETGKFLEYFTFMNHDPSTAKKLIAAAVKKYSIELIAIGNGTGGHDVQAIVADSIKEFDLNVQYTIVSEDGASVYSASDTAREEFPDLDLTIRGAISIGRRLQDPLAELVKIEPKAIGVGLYQHDVNQTKLSTSLDETVESVVNSVGVNINTASFSLLKYVSGINTVAAKKIVKYRGEKGLIKSRSELLKITGFGEKTYTQAAGFLKIPESADPLDNTWVHPEQYDAARIILNEIKTSGSVSKPIRTELKTKYNLGDTTIDDIIEELKKPNRDPREGFPMPIMQKGIVNFEDLAVGMKVNGKIKNVVDFGAFVDIGIKETALLHISEMSDTYISNPAEVAKVGDVVEAQIIEIDVLRKRVSLSLKSNPGSKVAPKARTEAPAKKKFDYSQYIV
ncbi:MAG: Tex-like protein [Spirochaetes bacterium GWF1_31_7]|nr:MAG: Tex-like protein [Spirochaetes bacterium GWE1_32_154]OHD48251.1 MAG: Tex-like protein [Spirochaetes bacterium GWE2_31_10]OHD50654.1 MAG: Tex-like protein [Spirochaetes bacterium GWF1_31_7]OHD82134.1 MAG: Tex-like protein [Spirochaetes bacterium RIFOXYB1_FULL_32_8]HBD96498.1 Tex-like protein [Spirochaetia bacterium]